MEVLVIDSTLERKSRGSWNLVRFLQQDPKVCVTVRRAPEQDFPKNLERWDRLVISGSLGMATQASSWIQALKVWLRKKWLLQNKPTLGVCFGHQILAQVLFGDAMVFRRKKGVFGLVPVDILQEDALFEKMPKTFYAFQSHFEQVSFKISKNKSLSVLAQSQGEDLEAFRMGSVYGVQFHLEKFFEEGQKELKDAKKKHGQKAQFFFPPKHLSPQGLKVLSEQFFRNFLHV